MFSSEILDRSYVTGATYQDPTSPNVPFLDDSDLCPETERSPVSGAPPSRQPHTVDGVTVMAWNRADAVATVYRLF